MALLVPVAHIKTHPGTAPCSSRPEMRHWQTLSWWLMLSAIVLLLGILQHRQCVGSRLDLRPLSRFAGVVHPGIRSSRTATIRW